MASTQDDTAPFDGLADHLYETLHSRDSQIICQACGTQYAEVVSSCKICDDRMSASSLLWLPSLLHHTHITNHLPARQFIPATGQQWTTLPDLRQTHQNTILPHPTAPNVYTIQTHPRQAIGQRAFIIQTSAGNILWDCLTLLDAATVKAITDLGGLTAIVISHPHFYTTHLLWAAVFNCPVYLADDDKQWLATPDNISVDAPKAQDPDMPSVPGAIDTAEPASARVFISGPPGSARDIPGTNGQSTGAKAVKVGGHFPGSMVLLHNDRIYVGDTIMPTPSGTGVHKKGMNSFSFMWSYPNMIPLSPTELASMWKALSTIEFTAVHGGFAGLDVEGPDTKERVLESMAMQVSHCGHDAVYWAAQFVGGLEQRSKNPQGMKGVEVSKSDVYAKPEGVTESSHPGRMVDNIAGGRQGVEGLSIEPKEVVEQVAHEHNMSGVTEGGAPAKMVGVGERVEKGMERLVEVQDRPVAEITGEVEGGNARVV